MTSVRKYGNECLQNEYEGATFREKAKIRKSLIHRVLDEDSTLIGCLCNGKEESSHLNLRHLARIVRSYFTNPSKPTQELWDEIGRNSISYEDLITAYETIQKIGLIQDMFTHDSVYPRIIGYIREQLTSTEDLERVFTKSDKPVIPLAIEFHPSLGCDARCKNCSNVCNERFQDYPVVGNALTQERLEKIIDVGIDIGVRRMSFAGGGEPMLSPMTIPSLVYARERSSEINLGLYTNGIRLASLDDSELEKLARSVDRLRISLDASNAQDWAAYKKREAEDFQKILRVMDRINRVRNRHNSSMKIGASYILRPDMPIEDVYNFIDLCHNHGLDFCDIKDCCGVNFGGQTKYYINLNNQRREQIGDLVGKIRIKSINGDYGEMNVALEDFFVSEGYSHELGIKPKPILIPSRCWMARMNRKLTIGPYGEIYPCSDAANPGIVNRLNGETRMAILTEFDCKEKLKKQFMDFLTRTSKKKDSFYPPSHIYCVPSNMDFNIAMEKLFVDWDSGIPIRNQPIAGGYGQYHYCRNIK